MCFCIQNPTLIIIIIIIIVPGGLRAEHGRRSAAKRHAWKTVQLFFEQCHDNIYYRRRRPTRSECNNSSRYFGVISPPAVHW